VNNRTKTKIRLIARDKRETKLNMVAKAILDCSQCLHLARGTGYGDPLSRIMIVAQSLHAPCPFTEKEIPFVGPSYVDSGDVLFSALERASIRVEDCWTTNLVKCHTPKNRPSTNEEIQKCKHFLELELSIIKPLFVFALGNQAFTFLKSSSSVAKKHIRAHHTYTVKSKYYGVDLKFFLIHLKHPSWAMRNGEVEEERWVMEAAKQFKRAKRVIEREE
jgi:uracil-DNA glycosylase